MDRVGLILLCLGAVGMGRLYTGTYTVNAPRALPTWLECCTDTYFFILRSASRRLERDS